MKAQDRYNKYVTWILVALLALIAIGVSFVDESYRSAFLSVVLVSGLAALAFVGFQRRKKQ